MMEQVLQIHDQKCTCLHEIFTPKNIIYIYIFIRKFTIFTLTQIYTENY